ncbi:hypothetical protein D3C81_1734560 [compost metagenome]
MLKVWRQAVLELRQIRSDVQFAAFDVLVDRRAFLHQQHTEDDHRQNRDHQADRQSTQGRQVALPAEFRLQPALHRRKHNAENHRPEHRAVERQEDPDKRHRDQQQQHGEGFELKAFVVHVRSMSVRRHARPDA